jgi:hypothetical protein
MAPIRAKESSRSFDGFGKVVRSVGGSIGLRGWPQRAPDMAEPARGRPYGPDMDDAERGEKRLDAEEPGRGGPRPPGALSPPTEPW